MSDAEGMKSRVGASERCLQVLCDMRCLVAITFIFLGIFLSIIAVGITQTTNTRDVGENIRKLSLVIDTDAGTDDALALMILLEAEKRHHDPAINSGPKIVAVTTVHGNTGVHNVTVNVMKILNMTGRLDGSVPVYRGASKSIKNTPTTNFFFGMDGMGDVDWVPEPSMEHLNRTHAAVALVDLANRFPGEISVLAIGPLTNIAMAIRLDETFLTKLAHLFIMGGSTEGRGAKMPGVEFNFYMDPEANYIVLKDSEYVKDTLSLLAWEQVENMKITQKWRAEELGALSSERMMFLNAAEGVGEREPSGMWEYADPVAAAVLLIPDLATHHQHLPVVPITQGETRGGIVVDYYGNLNTASTVHLVGGVDVQNYKELLLDYLAK